MEQNPTEQSPLTLYNVSTGAPEKLAPGQAEQAILSGTHSVPRGTTINVVGDDGTAGGIDSSELMDALKQGFKIETPFQKVLNDYSEDNKGFTGAAKVAASKAINELGFGVPEVIADEVQDPLEVAKRKRLEEEHAGAAILGTVGGIGGSLLYGGPLFKGATKAGQLVTRGAESAIARGLEKAGVQGAKEMAKSLAPRIATQAAGMAAEGAVVAAPRALTEAAFGDTDAAAESLLWGAGIGGMLGGSIAASSPIFKGVANVYKGVKNSGKVQLGIDDATKASIIADSPKPRVEAKGFTAAENIETKFPSLRSKNYDSIVNDGKVLGIDDLTYDVLSDSPAMKNSIGSLSESTSAKGIELKQKIVDNAAKLQESVEQSIGSIRKDAIEKTADTIKTQIDDVLAKKIANKDELYAQRAQEFDAVVLTDDETLKVFDKINKVADKWGSKNSKLAAKFREGVDTELRGTVDITGDVTTLESLLSQQSVINEQLRKWSREPGVVSGAVKQGYQEMKRVLDDEIKTILDSRSLGVPGATQEAQAIRGIAESAKQAFIETKRLQETVAKLFGGKANETPETFLRNLLERSDKGLVDRLAKLGSKELVELQAVSPELFELAKQSIKTNLVRQTGKSDFGLTSTIANFKKMDKGIKEIVFSPDEIAKLDAAARLWPRMEVNFNKSKSATTYLFNRPLLTKIQDAVESSVIDPIQAKAMDAAMGGTSAIPETQRLMKAAFKVIEKTDEAVEALLTRAPKAVARQRVRLGSVLERVVNDSKPKGRKQSETKDPQELLKEFAESASEMASNPDAGFERLDELFGGFGEMGAPETAMKAQAKAVQAMGYLYQNLPTLISPVNSFDVRQLPRVPESEIAAFERRLEVVQDPMVVPQRLLDGTLSREHVETLRAVYPSIYSMIQTQATETVLREGIENGDYSDRMKLALLLGIDTHASLSSSSILKLQELSARQSEAMGNQPAPSSKQGTTLAERTMTEGQKQQMA
jgi:hypothetical protein